jgi:hypothetical protein
VNVNWSVTNQQPTQIEFPASTPTDEVEEPVVESEEVFAEEPIEESTEESGYDTILEP